MSRLYNVKIVMLGDGGVGKTSLVLRYTKNTFESTYKRSIGATFAVKRIEMEGNPMNLLIWDLAGQPSFDTVRTHYYKGAQAALLVFDLTRRETFEGLNQWYDRFAEFSPDAIIVLVGNKQDLQADRKVSPEEVETFRSARPISYFETSCATGKGVTEAFLSLATPTYIRMSS